MNINTPKTVYTILGDKNVNVLLSVAIPHLRFSVLSLTRANCDLKELKGLWTSMTSCDLNVFGAVPKCQH